MDKVPDSRAPCPSHTPYENHVTSRFRIKEFYLTELGIQTNKSEAEKLRN
jgi:hypothetical protein